MPTKYGFTPFDEQRIQFAGMAMQGLISGHAAADNLRHVPVSQLAEEAVTLADALIAELVTRPYKQQVA